MLCGTHETVYSDANSKISEQLFKYEWTHFLDVDLHGSFNHKIF